MRPRLSGHVPFIDHSTFFFLSSFMNTFIRQNGRKRYRQYIQQTKQKKGKNMHMHQKNKNVVNSMQSSYTQSNAAHGWG